MTLSDDEPDEHRKASRGDTTDYRSWRYVDPLERSPISKGMVVEACLIGLVLILVWINAGIILWRNPLG
jgi:hypothetical protein